MDNLYVLALFGCALKTAINGEQFVSTMSEKGFEPVDNVGYNAENYYNGRDPEKFGDQDRIGDAKNNGAINFPQTYSDPIDPNRAKR